MSPGTKVIYKHQDEDDPQVGTVVDHEAADMTPPDIAVVLVRWTRTYVRWEYIADLQTTTTKENH